MYIQLIIIICHFITTLNLFNDVIQSNMSGYIKQMPINISKNKIKCYPKYIRKELYMSDNLVINIITRVYNYHTVAKGILYYDAIIKVFRIDQLFPHHCFAIIFE